MSHNIIPFDVDEQESAVINVHELTEEEYLSSKIKEWSEEIGSKNLDPLNWEFETTELIRKILN